MFDWVSLSALRGAAVGAVVSAVIWWLVWHGLEAYNRRRARKRLERLMRRLHERRPAGEVALTLSVSRPIKDHVRRFLDAHEETRGAEMVVVHQEGKFADGGDWLRFLSRVRKQHRQLCAAGAGRFLLFCNVPVSMALGVGAALMPGPEVVVFHYEAEENTYREIGLLHFDTTKA